MGICVSCRRRDRKAPSKSSGGGAAGAAARAKAELLPRRDHLAIMANSISNIKMTNPIKGIVSKRRKRYIKDGFNLDLAYITERLIAMGFPAEKLEGVYRNHIDEVYRFLEHKHKDHYKIYNLCSERSYDSSKFHERVAIYPFDDHSPPKIELIQSFCVDVHDWLSKDPKNVAAVHCKAGKGRTGTMVCCYLLYSGQETTADGALNHYGKERTHDLKGVTIPSQRRYVEYYAALVRGRLEYRACAVHIAELALSPPPTLNGGQCTLELWVAPAAAATTLGSAKLPACSYEMRRNESEIRMSLNHCTPLAGDVRVELYSKPKMMRKEKLFHFWFNTYFVTQQVGAVKVKPPDNCPDVEVFKLCLNKWQLDDAHKDKQHKLYSPNFKVELMVQKPPERSAWSGGRASAPARPPGAMKAASSPPDSFSDSTDDDREDDRDDDRDDENWSSGTSTEESVKLLDCVSPQLYADSRAFDAYCARPYADSPRDEVEGKIPKVSSDHTISSTDVCDRHYEPNRTCKSPTDNCKKKYLFFKKDSPEGRGGEEARECDRRTPTDFVSTFSKPRLSLGDMRASWREFSDKHFGTEHSKQKKKAADSSTESKDDS